MTPRDPVEAVRTGTDPRCHSASCRDSGCGLSLSDAPNPHVLVRLEHEGADRLVGGRQHCDYRFVGGNDPNHGTWVVPVELTTGRKRASEFLAQLRGGVAIADELLPTGSRIRFQPVAAHDGGLHRDEITNLRKSSSRISFRGDARPIELIRCGSRLVDALDDRRS